MTDSRIGSHIADDPRGWLRFTYLAAELRRAEDATLAADRERAGRPGDYGAVPTFTRPATATERTLLQHLGHTLPDNLNTTVTWVSDGVRNRRWIQLERTTT
jgi:hypothetical protein